MANRIIPMCVIQLTVHQQYTIYFNKTFIYCLNCCLLISKCNDNLCSVGFTQRWLSVLSWHHTVIAIHSLLRPHSDCHPFSPDTALWLPSTHHWNHILIAIHSLLRPHSDCHVFSPDTTFWSPSTLCWYHIVTAICFCSLLIPHCDQHSLSL